jgi:hypothetical protein
MNNLLPIPIQRNSLVLTVASGIRLDLMVRSKVLLMAKSWLNVTFIKVAAKSDCSDSFMIIATV